MGCCGSVGAGERDWDTKGPGSRSGLDPGLRFTFFLLETINQKELKHFLSVLKMAARS